MKIIVSCALLLLLSACGRTPERSLVYSEFLTDYSKLERAPEGGLAMVEGKDNFPDENYTKVIIDPIVTKFHKRSRSGKIHEMDINNLKEHCLKVLTAETKKQYEIVEQADEGTLRISAAITDVMAGSPGSYFTTWVIPGGFIASAIKSGATGKPIGVGEITVEIRVTDAMTDEVKLRYVNRKFGRSGRVSDSARRYGHARDSLFRCAVLLNRHLATKKTAETAVVVTGKTIETNVVTTEVVETQNKEIETETVVKEKTIETNIITTAVAETQSKEKEIK